MHIKRTFFFSQGIKKTTSYIGDPKEKSLTRAIFLFVNHNIWVLRGWGKKSNFAFAKRKAKRERYKENEKTNNLFYPIDYVRVGCARER